MRIPLHAHARVISANASITSGQPMEDLRKGVAKYAQMKLHKKKVCGA
jgi:hypothetical protein